MARGNTENLTANVGKTPEQRRESARRAGIASAAKRQEKKKLQGILKAYLESKSAEGMTQAELITAKLVEQAANGNVRAFEVIRDTIGEKPEENVNLNQIDITIFDES